MFELEILTLEIYYLNFSKFKFLIYLFSFTKNYYNNIQNNVNSYPIKKLRTNNIIQRKIRKFFTIGYRYLCGPNFSLCKAM